MGMTPVFYIESGSVSGALIDFSPTRKNISPVVIPVTQQFVLKESLRTDRLKIAVTDALKQVASELSKKAKEGGKKVTTGSIIILGAPWYVSQTTVIKETFRQPTVVTKKFFDDLIKKAVANFEKEHASSGNVSLLEQKVINAVLNGYQTNDPFNKKATDARFSLFLSVMPSDLKKQVEETLHAFFSRPIMAWQSAPLALFGGLRTLPATPNDFLILDTGAEVSELSLVRNNMLIETVSFPLGTSSMLRSMTTTLNSTYEVIESLVCSTHEQTQNSEMKERVDKALALSGDEWIKLFTSTLSLLAGGLSLPSTLFLISPKGWESTIEAFIKKENYGIVLLAEKSFSIYLIEAFSTNVLFLRTFQKTKIS